MDKPRTVRYTILCGVLLIGVYWVLASAAPVTATPYPNGQFLISAAALQQRLAEEPLVVIDVRNDKHFDGKVIPGAIRMPWSAFRQASTAQNMGGLFVGIDEAQKILGRHGVFRNDTVVLYDSVARDGGATASYVFWILDMLGHEKMMILERGIDGWLEAGGQVDNEPAQREPLLYQAPSRQVDLRRWADEDFIYPRLGDPYYQILDVRSHAEYLGEKLNPALDETPLKAGHIPGAININYEDNWRDPESKGIKSYSALQALYRGISPDKAVIVYCHSARRSSFSYFILRLIGFDDVIVYDNSWFGWGQPDGYYPVETREHRPSGTTLPGVGTSASPAVRGKSPAAVGQDGTKQQDSAGSTSKGYISCGG